MLTARQLADKVREIRQATWDKRDAEPAIVAAEKLAPDDEIVIRKAVADEGFTGDEAADMAKRVAAYLIGSVQAQSDDMPTTGGD